MQFLNRTTLIENQQVLPLLHCSLSFLFRCERMRRDSFVSIQRKAEPEAGALSRRLAPATGLGGIG